MLPWHYCNSGHVFPDLSLMNLWVQLWFHSSSDSVHSTFQHLEILLVGMKCPDGSLLDFSNFFDYHHSKSYETILCFPIAFPWWLWLVMLIIFSHIYWFSFDKRLFSSGPIFIRLFFSWYWVDWILIWLLIIYQLYSLQIFFTFCGLSFHFIILWCLFFLSLMHKLINKYLLLHPWPMLLSSYKKKHYSHLKHWAFF